MGFLPFVDFAWIASDTRVLGNLESLEHDAYVLRGHMENQGQAQQQ